MLLNHGPMSAKALKFSLFCILFSLNVTAQNAVYSQKSKQRFLPGVWITGQMRADSSVSPVLRPDESQSVYYGYYTLKDDNTFIYYAYEGEGISSEVSGTWTYNEKKTVLSLFYLKKEQGYYSIMDEKAPIFINKRYDYKVLRLTESDALITAMTGNKPEQTTVWALLKAKPSEKPTKEVKQLPLLLNDLVNAVWVDAWLDKECKVQKEEHEWGNEKTITFSADHSYSKLIRDGGRRSSPGYSGTWNYDPATNLLVMDPGTEYQRYFIITQLDSRALVLSGVQLPGDRSVPDQQVYLKR